MRGDWPVLLQALHADGGVDGYGQFEFLGIDVIIGFTLMVRAVSVRRVASYWRIKAIRFSRS